MLKEKQKDFLILKEEKNCNFAREASNAHLPINNFQF